MSLFLFFVGSVIGYFVMSFIVTVFQVMSDRGIFSRLGEKVSAISERIHKKTYDKAERFVDFFDKRKE